MHPLLHTHLGQIISALQVTFGFRAKEKGTANIQTYLAFLLTSQSSMSEHLAFVVLEEPFGFFCLGCIRLSHVTLHPPYPITPHSEADTRPEIWAGKHSSKI